MADKRLKIWLKFMADKTGLTKSVKGIKSVGTAARKMGKTVNKALGGMKKGYDIAARGAGKLKGVLLAGGVGLAAAIKESSDFNVEMARVWTLKNWSPAKFRAMKKEAQDLATEFGITKKEVSGGLYQAVSAGVPEGQEISFLRTSLKAAVADGSDVSVIVDGLTNVINSYGIAWTNADKVADGMLQVVKKGKVNFNDLASSIGTSAGTASALGVEIYELEAAITTLTKTVGKSPAEASTGIRNMMTILSQELGDGWAKTKSLQGALQEVYEGVGGSESALIKMFGRENLPYVLGLVGDNAKTAATDLKEMGETAGLLDVAFEKVDQFRHWPKIWQEIHSHMLAVGEGFNDVLAPVINKITSNLKEWRNSTDIFDKLETKLAAIRDKASDIWAAATQGGEGGNLLKTLGTMIKAAFMLGVDAAIKLFLRWAPIIGEAIGQAAKKAFDLGASYLGELSVASDTVRDRHGGQAKGALYSYRHPKLFNAEVQQEKDRLHQMNLEGQGQSLVNKYSQNPSAALSSAVHKFNAIADEGAAINSGAITKAQAKAQNAVTGLLDVSKTINNYMDNVLESLSDLDAVLKKHDVDIKQVQSQIKNGPRA